MNQKIKIWLSFFLILVIILISGWLMLRSNPVREGTSDDDQLKSVILASTREYNKRQAKYTSVASEDITKKYLPIWKKLFMEKNNISEDYFNKHILVLETGISTDQSRQIGPPMNRGREYFEVLYNIKVDWIEFNNSDHLVIRNKNRQEYLNIDEFIKEEQDAKETFQKVSNFIPIEKAPLSFEEAVKKLRQINSDAKYLMPINLTLGFKSVFGDKNPVANGGVLLYGEGIIDEEKNECVSGYLNIVTGESSFSRYGCWPM